MRQPQAYRLTQMSEKFLLLVKYQMHVVYYARDEAYAEFSTFALRC